MKTTGRITPTVATVKLSLKYFFNKSRSLSSPAKNISRITPNSENRLMISFGLTQFKIAGPSKIPDNSCPITAGILKRANNCPSKTVVKRIKISCPKKCIFSPSVKKTKNFQVLPDPKKRILKVFIVIKTQPLKIFS